MRPLKYFLLIVFIFLFYPSLLAQSQYIGKPGSCYVKCEKPDLFDTIYTFQYIFTGDINAEKVNIEEQTIEVVPARSEWVKTKTAGCRSANPDDCLVWCKVDKPAEIEKLYILKDTTQTKNFTKRKQMHRSIIEKGGKLEFIEVVCQNQVDKILIKKIQEALVRNEYLFEGFYKKGKMDKSTKSAIVEYQKDKGLYFGGLTFETLHSLGIAPK